MQGQQATHLFGPALIGIRTVCVYIRRDRQFRDGTHREQKRREKSLHASLCPRQVKPEKKKRQRRIHDGWLLLVRQ
jgi:hypothetical protein